MNPVDSDLLAQCIRSGQVEADEIVEQFKDRDFKKYYMEKYI